MFSQEELLRISLALTHYNIDYGVEEIDNQIMDKIRNALEVEGYV